MMKKLLRLLFKKGKRAGAGVIRNRKNEYDLR